MELNERTKKLDGERERRSEKERAPPPFRDRARLS
jgi:hypothetical protein